MTTFSIANINPGLVRHEFMVGVMGMVEHERSMNESDVHLAQFYAHLSGPYLDVGRNVCVERFLGEGSDWLLFIDSDMAPQPNQAFDLIQHAHEAEVTLLGGVYFNAFTQYHEKFNGLRPLAYLWQDDPQLDGQRNLLPLTHEALTAAAEVHSPTAVPVDAFGTGFMAIHRSLLMAMREHFKAPLRYFAELIVPGDIWMGEDLTFCLRAASLGHQPYVDPSIIVSHIKPMGIRPDMPAASPVPSNTVEVS